ncbi:MAG: DUF814 domain-containing protein [Flavobacteriales bacterium]|nr:DUF814 domain-containing protein [Flavobacteriales bacterium]
MLEQAFRLEILAKALNERLSGQTLNRIYSSSKNDLWLEFNSIVLHLVFYRGRAYWLLSDSSQQPGGNKVPQFRPVHGAVLMRVEPHRYDRSYSFVFTDNFQLHFLHFGRNSKVVFTEDQVLAGIFPTTRFEADQEFSIKPIEISEHFLNDLAPDDLSEKLKFLNESQKNKLKLSTFFHSKDRELVWNQFVENELALYPRSEPGSGQIEWTSDPTDILSELDEFARSYLRQQRFNDLQQELSRNISKELERKQAKFDSLQKSLRQKEGALSYRQKADILMANVHRTDTTDELECYDFYHDRTVQIRLKSSLSIQENAARLYRKAKQEHREINELLSRKENLRTEIEQLKRSMEELESASDYRALSRLRNATHSKKDSASGSSSNRTILYQGYEIRVGGNSKQNEQILREARKEDIWLHVRELSGAHVVIRLNRAQNVPEHILEFAASLAAWYSKARNEQLAAVIHTRRKFVRKFKGAETGQVRVEREATVMVQPKFWKTCLEEDEGDPSVGSFRS